MRTMLLSLRPDVFDNVRTGKKIFEHRKVFPDEPIKAYIYVSRPRQELAGVMLLNNRQKLSDWETRYAYDESAQKRIRKYMEHHRYVMEIQEFQDTTHISLSEIKQRFPDFLIPQMYYYLDDTELLSYLQKQMKPIGKNIVNDFTVVESTQICIN